MANITSQMKRNRQNERRRLRNKSVRSEIKTRMKRFEQALAAGDPEAVSRTLRIAVKKLDHAASKGVIHKNKAANHKSALMRRASQLPS